MRNLEEIRRKVTEQQRISTEDAIDLFRNAPLAFLANMADQINLEKNAGRVYFNRNFHFEPTNICIHNCLFCSYRRRINDPEAWEHDLKDVVSELDRFADQPVTEVHIVGGVHPKRDLNYYADMIREIRRRRPGLYIKAFTAVELDFMFRKSGVSDHEGLAVLKEAGLDAIPGGGAEIFDEELRSRICPDKTGSQRWLDIHKAAHQSGIPTNATMLYGHLESYEQRVDHLSRLRQLQDETLGFQVFIPLKYRKWNNLMSEIGETTPVEDLRNYAVSRIFLDNFRHIKAYWPMIGREIASHSLLFGVSDLDGTIDDTTKIYSMAGAEDQHPSMTSNELVELIRKAGRQPVERDTLYNSLREY